MADIPLPRVLIVDDERNLRDFLREAIEAEGFAVSTAGTLRSAVERARQDLPHLVLLDQHLPDGDGLGLLDEFKGLPVIPAVIVMTAFATYSGAVGAVKAGAYDYLSKPFEFESLLAVLQRAATESAAFVREAAPEALRRIVGQCPQIVDLKRKIVRIAGSPLDVVLIRGESGSGKELVARAIHELSGRSGEGMVAVNCAALPETLLMSELFGHEKGAFTDAKGERKGLFERAHQGTLLLDEVSEMGPAAQAALLRVLEERVITRVGGNREIPVDVRVVAATNVPLEECIEAGTFRADLYYRLNIVELDMPPLRERGDDVLLLARSFCEALATQYGRAPCQIDDQAAAVLTSYRWPGNVRELHNAIERGYAMGTGAGLALCDLPVALCAKGANGDGNGCGSESESGTALAGQPFREAKQLVIDRFERRYLEAALRSTRGNVTHAASIAGLHRQGFQRLLDRHGIDRAEFKDQVFVEA